MIAMYIANPSLHYPPALSLLRSHNRLFWGLQGAGWSGYFLLVYVAVVIPRLTPDNLLIAHTHIFLETMTGLLTSLALRQVLRLAIRLPLSMAAIGAVILSALFAAVWNFFKLCTFDFLYNFPWLNWSWHDFGAWYLFSLTTMAAWTGLYFVFKFYGALQAEHHKALQAESSAREAQLKMLRYQLNPHFMFNTMNAISTLILKRENDTAGEMVDQLCQFLRSSLDNDPSTQVTLKNELEALDLYLNIEKVRFEKRLLIKRSIDPVTQFALVPNLLLQPLAENAIKYAIAPRKHGGELIIKTTKQGGELVIEVGDDGPGLEDSKGGNERPSGIGLSNTRNRLTTLYGSNHKFSLKSHANGLTVEIRIPFQSGSTANGTK
ncbi:MULTISPECIES: sensor histidine kinase [Microbulbifer]|uniref:sensor histidine kinase n=1 Tax=Microbulbifer TaxID=48073 RepID=UPI001CD22F56|nr:histidine kinase [Microbulbifer agarilyticus]MCA0900260.1 histidine kinase [Microbulbifer agarilyticus]